MTALLAMLLAAPALDAGVAADAGRADAGVAHVTPTVDVAAVVEAAVAPLRKRVIDLETRAAELENKVQTIESLSRKVDQLSSTVTTLERDVKEREAERVETERRTTEQRQRTEAVSRGLVWAEQQLALGTTPNGVSDALRAAEATATGPAQQYVQAARTALANGDLSSARKLIGLALLEMQAAPAR